MCLGIPGRIVRITGPRELAMATVDIGGTSREACLAYLPDALVGDWVLVQTGFVVLVVDEASAQESLSLLGELGSLGAEGS